MDNEILAHFASDANILSLKFKSCFDDLKKQYIVEVEYKLDQYGTRNHYVRTNSDSSNNSNPNILKTKGSYPRFYEQMSKLFLNFKVRGG